MRILITGAAGFVGYHTAVALLQRGDEVVGLDNLNDYYDVNLKQARLDRLNAHDRFAFHKADLADTEAVASIFRSAEPHRVIHLGAQAGVRYSITNPHAYAASNLAGTLNVLEGCRHHGAEHLVYASSSSVYGANRKLPFSVHDRTDHPVSLYAATKKSNEMMAHVYATLYRLPATGLRFFTVYGPWGRPDMAYYEFTRRILAGEPIDVFNHGRHQRDFTYIDDIVAGVVGISDIVPVPDPAWSGTEPDTATSSAPYRLYNIGNHEPVALGDFIATLERLLGRTAVKNYLPMQPGDVEATFADIDDMTEATGFRPSVSIEDGLARFVAWYRDYHGV
jgi:UDP-glucuronate 4-epimerase